MTPKAGLKTMPTGILKNEQVFNEGVLLLEALTYRGVSTRSIVDPAGISPSPVNGDVYFVPDGSPNALGDWSGQGGSLAVYSDGWRFIPPGEGLTVWIIDEAQSIQFRNGEWVELSEFAAQELNELTDVDFSGSPSPQDKDILEFDGPSGKWVPRAAAGSLYTKVELTGSEVVSANAAVVWDQVRESNGIPIMWVIANPTRLTADSDGVYLWGFHGDTAGISTRIFAGVYKVGSTKSTAGDAESLSRKESPGGASSLFGVTGGGILLAGEYIEAVAHVQGFTLDAVNQTSFWLMRVATI